MDKEYIQPTTIILCAGSIDHSHLPIGTHESNAMIPVNGKPVMSWLLDDLLQRMNKRIIIVVRENDAHLRLFLQWAYSKRICVTTVSVPEGGTIVESLLGAFQGEPIDGPVRIVLGDTLITDADDTTIKDFVRVGSVNDSRRWCVITTASDGRIVEYRDKSGTPQGEQQALAGYYHLQDGAALFTAALQSVEAGAEQLSDVLQRYSHKYPIYALPVSEWYDFGHIDRLVDARRRLLRPRFFNSLHIDAVLNTITKVSDHSEKLRDELDWYLSLPSHLQVLTPRIVRSGDVDGKLEIVQEYYGYPTLSELYVYGELQVDTWFSILRQVLRVHEEFRRYLGTIEHADLEHIYVTKTFQRIAQLRASSQAWEYLLSLPEIEYNGEVLYSLDRLSDQLGSRLQKIIQNASISIIHGDLCFSNILFDPSSYVVRLIDPRGSFGRKGIYGDSRYDIAKLRHSISGRYDYIVADLFDLRETNYCYTGQIYSSSDRYQLVAGFDKLIADMGYDVSDIRFIEGLLFISMLPLHQDHPRRQIMMYLTGLRLLNEELRCV